MQGEEVRLEFLPLHQQRVGRSHTVHACETSLQFLFSSSPAAQEKLQSMVRIEGKKKNLLTQVDFKG